MGTTTIDVRDVVLPTHHHLNSTTFINKEPNGSKLMKNSKNNSLSVPIGLRA
jgi:hypothetical protein